jgi:hypothetical protein
MATTDSIGTDSRRRGRFNVLGFMFFFAAMIGLYLLAQAAPIYLHRRAMQDASAEIVQRAARQNLDLNDVKAQLHESARQNSLPDDTHITISRDGRKVTALIAYENSISLPGKSWPWPQRLRVEDLGY